MPDTVATHTLIGKVNVLPPTARPGEPVLVQVCDPDGHPYGDNSGVTITIEGVEAASRYYQFASVGTRNLTVRAVKGAIRDSTVISIAVAGQPMSYRRTLTAPTLTALPILELSQDLSRPYTASLDFHGGGFGL